VSLNIYTYHVIQRSKTINSEITTFFPLHYNNNNGDGDIHLDDDGFGIVERKRRNYDGNLTFYFISYKTVSQLHNVDINQYNKTKIIELRMLKLNGIEVNLAM
jgi:hypothetical protein